MLTLDLLVKVIEKVKVYGLKLSKTPLDNQHLKNLISSLNEQLDFIANAKANKQAAAMPLIDGL